MHIPVLGAALGQTAADRDASGNIKLQDIGRLLREKIEQWFHLSTTGQPSRFA